MRVSHFRNLFCSCEMCRIRPWNLGEWCRPIFSVDRRPFVAMATQQ